MSMTLQVYPSRCVLATCNLNQWALDFDGNLSRSMESMREAKRRGASYRLGPELELSGYSCEDHFLEMDTYLHCEQSLAQILESDVTEGILCDIGTPMMHNGIRYNCRVFCLNRKIVLIRPKADDGNYREPRFFRWFRLHLASIDPCAHHVFSAWKRLADMESHHLSPLLVKASGGQREVPFGVAVIRTTEATLASECCEELWTLLNPHIDMLLSGVDIIANGSGSHHQLRKLHARVDLIRNATRRGGGAYLFANHKGGDGGRLYYDGCSLICVNGEVVAQGAQFGLLDVEVLTATVDLQDIRSYRQNCKSNQEHGTLVKPLPEVLIPDSEEFSLLIGGSNLSQQHSVLCVCSLCHITSPLPGGVKYHTPEVECALGPACWLWDFLRRSRAAGFLLPLSGGADSAAVAAIVHVMSTLVSEAAKAGNRQVARDLEWLLLANEDRADWDAKLDIEAATVTKAVLHTIYIGTSNSTEATKLRAASLAVDINAYHLWFSIDTIVSAVVGVFRSLIGRTPRYQSEGGSLAEDLALQNIQARLRMVMSYMCAQLFPWIRGRSGFLLVLGSGNVDEALRGYLTKYDCSSADINPIGGICKGDLKRMIKFVADSYGVPSLLAIADAPPTAELRPIMAAPESGGSDLSDHSQLDEVDMGMTYEELGLYGHLRKSLRCGPVSMFVKLCAKWGHRLSASEVAVKVKSFFFHYSANRHKCTVLTPSYHAENYSPDDNRFDMRPFLYNVLWTRQFNTIDHMIRQHESLPQSQGIIGGL